MQPFYDFENGFRSSPSTADLLTVLSDRIVRAFNRSRATWAVAIDIFKAFNRGWHAGLLHKLKYYGISGQMFDLISSFLSKRQLWVVLDGISWQEYPVNAGVPQRSSLGPTLFLLYINDLTGDVICNIAIYADDITLFSKCDQASDLLQQLESASELESDLQDTCVWTVTGIGLLISMLEKLLFDLEKLLFVQSNNTGATDVSVLEKKSSFKACIQYFLSNFYFSPNYSPSKNMKKI